MHLFLNLNFNQGIALQVHCMYLIVCLSITHHLSGEYFPSHWSNLMYIYQPLGRWCAVTFNQVSRYKVKVILNIWKSLFRPYILFHWSNLTHTWHKEYFWLDGMQWLWTKFLAKKLRSQLMSLKSIISLLPYLPLCLECAVILQQVFTCR